jgi:DNA-binding GntR family transcriptional regulator
MSPQLRRDDPPYLQIAQQIRADIESGKLAEGDRIPSARDITATWGVALATATKVHARLRSEGLIESVPGVGTVVRSEPTSFSRSGLLQSSQSRGRVYRVDEYARIVSAELLSAPDSVADALGVGRGSQVIRRERVTLRNDELLSTSISWFPGEIARLAPKLLVAERIPDGTFAYAGSSLGKAIVSGRERMSAEQATDDQASTLHLAARSPVLVSQTWFYADDGTVIEFGESVHAGGRWLSHDFTIQPQHSTTQG